MFSCSYVGDHVNNCSKCCCQLGPLGSQPPPGSSGRGLITSSRLRRALLIASVWSCPLSIPVLAMPSFCPAGYCSLGGHHCLQDAASSRYCQSAGCCMLVSPRLLHSPQSTRNRPTLPSASRLLLPLLPECGSLSHSVIWRAAGAQTSSLWEISGLDKTPLRVGY